MWSTRTRKEVTSDVPRFEMAMSVVCRVAASEDSQACERFCEHAWKGMGPTFVPRQRLWSSWGFYPMPLTRHDFKLVADQRCSQKALAPLAILPGRYRGMATV